VCIFTDGEIFKNICQILIIWAGSQQTLSKDVVDNVEAVSNLASKMIALLYLKAKDKEEERSFDEK
jgi:hypothetical protein